MAKVRAATSGLNVCEVHIHGCVKVIVVACVVNVARRAADGVDAEGTRSVKVFRVVAGTRISIRVTKRTSRRARLPRRRVRRTRRVVARTVGAGVVRVVPGANRHTSLVLQGRRAVSKTAAAAVDVTRIRGQRALVAVRTVVAASSVKVIAVIIR